MGSSFSSTHGSTSANGQGACVAVLCHPDATGVHIGCPIGLPPAMATDPEKSGIPIMGITMTCAISQGKRLKIAPLAMGGPGNRVRKIFV